MSADKAAPATEKSEGILPSLPSIDVDNLKSVDGVVREITSLNSEFMPMLITVGGRIVAALVILIISWMVGNWVDRRFENMKHLDSTLRNFIGNFFKYLIFAIGVITVIGLFGIPMASLLAVMGAAGLAIGLALQGTLANVASGVMLLILRPFNVGDYITWGNQGGTVKSLGLFGTELAMADNVYLFAPNSKIWGNEICNFSRNMLRRQDITINISYEDDINKVFKIIHSILDADERVLKEPEDKRSQVITDNMADFSISIIARFWSNTSNYWALRWDVTKQIKEALEKEGVTIPITTRQLSLTQDQR